MDMTPILSSILISPIFGFVNILHGICLDHELYVRTLDFGLLLLMERIQRHLIKGVGQNKGRPHPLIQTLITKYFLLNPHNKKIEFWVSSGACV